MQKENLVDISVMPIPYGGLPQREATEKKYDVEDDLQFKFTLHYNVNITYQINIGNSLKRIIQLNTVRALGPG